LVADPVAERARLLEVDARLVLAIGPPVRRRGIDTGTAGEQYRNSL